MSLREDIESRVQILDIVNRYVSTKKAWVNYKWLCPFHTEKTASFIVSPSKNIAHCFSCGKWWGPIKFLMEIEKIEFREAASILAKEVGIELKTDFARESREKWEDIYALYREATSWYHEALFLPENNGALLYIQKRWLSLETLKKFEIGFSSSPRDLLFVLREKGFVPKFIIDSWLFVSETRDKFFGRLIFPIKNALGHTIAFTGRALSDDIQPKYLNSPASSIFDKSSVLYGFNLAKQIIAKSWEVYIVEWQMDTIALHQAGVENAVGISGTALTKDHIRILKRFAHTVYLSLDSDDAGVKATFSSIENLLNEDLEIRIIRIPNGKDPDEFVKSGWNFWVLKNDALSVIQFYLLEGKREFDIAWIVWKKKLAEKCLSIISLLKSQIEIDIYLKQVSSHLDIWMDILYTEYKKIKNSFNKVSNIKKYEKSEKSVSVFQPNVYDLVAGYIYKYDFFDLFFRDFWYTVDDLLSWVGTTLLTSVLQKSIDSDAEESLRIIALYLEQSHESATNENIQKSFTHHVKHISKLLLDSERETILSTVSQDSPEYLSLLASILAKEKKLWLRS